MTGDSSPDLLADVDCETGENPLWHPEEGVLYWTDIPRGRLFRYDPGADAHEQVYDGDVVGGFTVAADGRLLLFGAGGRVWTWDPGSGATTGVVDGIPRERNTRFNDVLADPEGRVFAGCMPTDDQAGALYRVDTDGTVERVIEGMGIPNGMGFTPDLSAMYVTDSTAGTIRRYEYERATGRLFDPETVVSVPDDAGVPDGMTVDATGHLWSARWGGGCVVRYAPDGTEVDRVSVPTPRASSVAFGGSGFQTAYVTTAGGDDRGTYGERAGALFCFEPGEPGRAGFRSRVG